MYIITDNINFGKTFSTFSNVIQVINIQPDSHYVDNFDERKSNSETQYDSNSKNNLGLTR